MIPDPVEEGFALGWSIIPVRSNKKPFVRWRRYQNERATLEQLNEWATSLNPDAWGLVTGPISDVLGTDYDGQAGQETLERFGLSPHIRTGSGGFHHYARYPGFDIRTQNHVTSKSLGSRFPGVDVRADGGYAIFCGHNERGEYVPMRPLTPDAFEVLPEELREFLRRDGSDRSQKDNVVSIGQRSLGHRDEFLANLINRALGRLLEEGRNDAGLWLSCQCRDNRFSKAEGWMAMQVFQQAVPPVNAKGELEAYTEAEARATLDQAYSREPRRALAGAPSNRPMIMVSGVYLDEKVADALLALQEANDPPVLFRRGGTLVRARVNEEDQMLVEPITTSIMIHLLSEAADFATWDRNGEPSPVDPPARVAESLLASGEWDLPVLRGVVETPLLRSDGSIVTDPGYDSSSGFFLHPPTNLVIEPVAADPTDEDVNLARGVLVDDLLGEFPFSDDAALANSLGLVITGVIREAIPGLVPLTLVTAPQAGTGKGALVNVTTLLATGRMASITAIPSNDEEFRKRLTAMLFAGERFVVLDNLEEVLKSPTLAALLTADSWGDRILGHSKYVKFPQRAVVIGTGNNLRLGGDLARRTIQIELDARMARPWERRFLKEDLNSSVLARRGEYLHAVFVLARRWWSQGQPRADVPAVAGFQGWCNVIGGILASGGINGFLGNVRQVYEQADEESTEIALFLSAWRERFGSRATAVSELALVASDLVAATLPSSLVEHLEAASGLQARQSRLAHFMSRIEGRRFDDAGLRVESAGRDSHTKAKLWRVIQDSER